MTSPDTHTRPSPPGSNLCPLGSPSTVIEENGVKLKLTVTDTPGFGDQINNDKWWVLGSGGPSPSCPCLCPAGLWETSRPGSDWAAASLSFSLFVCVMGVPNSPSKMEGNRVREGLSLLPGME